MAHSPEQSARLSIDTSLMAAGWAVQDMAEFNRTAAEGVAVREFTLPSGPCDYLLFIGSKACGVIEAKKAGVTLSGVAEQAARYMSALPDPLARWTDRLVFDYESTGDETYFRDTRDPAPRSRRLFAFHQPATLHAWLKEADKLRHRLRRTRAIDVRYLNAVLMRYPFIPLTTGTTARRKLTQKALMAAPLAIPPLEEHLVIFEVLDLQLGTADRMRYEAQKVDPQSNALRQSVLKAAFSGQRVPEDPTDEPASTLLARLAAQADDTPTAPRRRGRPPVGTRP